MQRGLLLALTGLLTVAGIATWWWSDRSSDTSGLPAVGEAPSREKRDLDTRAVSPTALVAPTGSIPGQDDQETDRNPSRSSPAPDALLDWSTLDAEVRASTLRDMAGTGGVRSRYTIPTPPVVLFEHATHDGKFPGRSWDLLPGLTNAGARFADDEASAVKIPGGLLVTLFEDKGGKGARVALGAGTHNLAPYKFSDRVSSVRVSRVGQDVVVPKGPQDTVLLYEHLQRKGGPQGKVWKLPLDDEDAQLFSSEDDHFAAHQASAAWVPLGLELTLFAQPDGRGAAMVMGPGFYELAVVGFNDRACSASVRRAGN